MTEEQIKQRIPPQSVQEYLRHGKEALASDDEARQIGFDADGNRLPPADLDKAAKKVYQRRLRDYAVEFDQLNERRVAMEVATAAINKDIERTAAALTSAKEFQAARELESKKLNTDLSGVKKERLAIEQHLAKVQQQLTRARGLLANLLEENSALARRLANNQGDGAALQSRPPSRPRRAELEAPSQNQL